jgi:farnesyl diphosphate synthase
VTLVIAMVLIACQLGEPGAMLGLRWRQNAERFPATALRYSLQLPEYPHFDVESSETLRASFVVLGDMLIDEVCHYLSAAYKAVEHDVSRVRRMLQYNLRGGKLNRGITTLESGLQIIRAQGRRPSNEEAAQLGVLGWCVEWLQGWALMADDIMDGSPMRRGKKAWYRHEDVKMNAVNDVLMLESLIYTLLKRHFANKPRQHYQFVDLFHETTLQTEYGELLDVECLNLHFDDFTPERWTAISKYKTALYSFYMPVALAMIYAGISDAGEYRITREIMVMMGIYFQAQDDFLDCFGLPQDIGKVGTDIADKKCSWLFVHAYHNLAQPEERALLAKLYGNCKPESAEECRVKDVYLELQMSNLYQRYEEESFGQILALKGQLRQVPWTIFEAYLSKIYKRTK